jgi:hypothetical protein
MCEWCKHEPCDCDEQYERYREFEYIDRVSRYGH